MDYEQAKAIRPGDTIRYTVNDGIAEREVTGPVHVFRPPRGRVVFVPVEGELVVHVRIANVERRAE